MSDAPKKLGKYDILSEIVATDRALAKKIYVLTDCMSAVTVPDGKGGEGEVRVLFDGQKGRITEVTVGAPWAGTSMESCVKRSFVGDPFRWAKKAP